MRSLLKVLLAAGVIVACTVLLEIILAPPQGEFWWQRLAGFSALYGFGGCILLILVAKTLGRLFIQREESFYGGGEENHG